MTALLTVAAPHPRLVERSVSALVMSERGGFLVVEDDLVTAADLAEALRDAGARVVGTVSSVEAALNLIAGAGPLDGASLNIHLRG